MKGLHKLLIREGQLDDLKELQGLFVDTIKSICSADYDPLQIDIWLSSVEDEERWNKIIAYQFVLVAQSGNKIVGFTTLDNSNYIDLFYVHKDYQRQGIANKMYAAIEVKAKQLRQTELTSDVSKTAKPFFEKVGFTVLKEQAVTRQGVGFVNYKMRKELSSSPSTGGDGL